MLFQRAARPAAAAASLAGRRREGLPTRKLPAARGGCARAAGIPPAGSRADVGGLVEGRHIEDCAVCPLCISRHSRAATRAYSVFHDLAHCFSDYGDASKAIGAGLFELPFDSDVFHDPVLGCWALDCIGRTKTLVGFGGLLEHTTQLQIAPAHDHRAGQRLEWSGIGRSRRQSDAQECVQVHERELNLAKDLGDRSAKAPCGSLGLAILDAGRLQEAIDRLSEKLPITQEKGSKAEEGRALLALGEGFLANRGPQTGT